MGKRAERRKRRASKQQALPGGKTVLPSGFVYGFCSGCEHNRSGVIDDTGVDDVHINVCGRKCRKNIYHVNARVGKNGMVLTSTWDRISVPATLTELKKRKSVVTAVDVSEDCPNMVLMLMDADVGGFFS